ncbi:ABC transporter permease [Terriglobus saanensis]|uniref:Permease n=1 Tax=Terriglobus saanensis (strain ATCC BAA-1853 / DSM 23119 / SP1PR4) TaxID=401053 RepID=E8V0Y2_TERSS|nr:ABC transporter permease [Terriglobus saanensis]ADV82273.1 permease [Terriglobus saanensis SP1PR4]
MSDRARTFMARWSALFGQRRAESSLDEELRTHLEMLAEKYEQAGMSSREAAQAARRQFGNTTLLKQRQREARTTMFFANTSRDLRYGVRQLAKTPVFTIVCVLTLALGVGANTAVFSVMHAVLIKMLPVQDASRVFYVHTTGWPDGASQTGEGSTSFSYPVYRALRERSGLQQVMAFIPMSSSGKAAVRVGTVPEEAAGDMVSGNYFSGLGVGTELGRGFVEKDEDDHTPVVVISESFWTTHYARSRDVLGKPLYIKSIPFTIVGVAAKGFEGTEGSRPLEFWIPLQSRPEFNAWGNPAENGMYLTKQNFWCMKLMVRAASGGSREQVVARAQAVFEQAAYIGVRPKRAGDETYQLSFTEAKQFDSQDDSFARSLKILMAMVGLVLLIAMSNVIMLLMARNANRQREFSVRLALGAGRREMFLQLLTESVLLVTLGGIAAWAFALGATHALGSWAHIESNLQPDGTVLWFTLSVLFLLALVFGLAPLRAAMSGGSDMVVRSSATVSQSSSQKMRVGNAVIVTQIAMCVVLLVGAGLLLGTLRNLLNTPLGQKPQGLLVFGIHPQHADTKEESIAFFVNLQQRLRTIPGVESVSMASNRPGSGWSNNNGGLLVDGHKPNGIEPGQANYRGNVVGADYFRTMGVQVIQGRDFSDADSPAAPKTVIVNETFAKKYLGNLNAVGHVLSDPKGTDPTLIIGVVKDHKYTGITEETRPMLWTVFTQGGAVNQLNIEMRVPGNPMAMLPAVRKVITQIDPDMPLLEPTTQSAVFEQSISQQALFARLAGCFGVLAVVLIATGLYGTLAYRVSRRSAEIGVRMALGAQRSQVVWMVLRGSLLLCAAGVVLGVPLAMAAGKGLESSLYGMKSLDPASYLMAIVGVALVALLASAVPAGRAANVDPLSALRSE